MAEVEEVRERAPRLKDQAMGAGARKDEDHTRWVRDDPRRIREVTNQGYVVAKEADVDRSDPNARGYKQGDVIRDGDLILMKTQREIVEQKELKRRQDMIDSDKAVNHIHDKQGGFTADPERNYQEVGGRKNYNIPWEPTK